jgi:AraC family transcriptional regulator
MNVHRKNFIKFIEQLKGGRLLANTNVIKQAVVFIEENLNKAITAEDVAAAVAYSYYHFHRFFYSMVGETIGDYIRSRRLTQAAYLLTHTQKSIMEISAFFGFETPEGFARAFKKRYAIAPTAYRKRRIDVLIGNQVQLDIDFWIVNKRLLTPEIVMIPPKKLVGLRFEVGKIKDGYLSTWQKHMAKLPPSTFQEAYYGIYELPENCLPEMFNLNVSSHLFIGQEAVKGVAFSDDFQLKQFSGGKYAKFIHKGSVKNILQTYYYIWGIWLLKSNYSVDNRADFEHYTERFQGEDSAESEIDIYIPIQ